MLQRLGTEVRRSLTGHCRVGRTASCELRIDEPYISREHAVLSWTGTKWEVRDLGSRNGTSVGGRPLKPGRAKALQGGAKLAFGDARETWQLVDAGRPEPFAVTEDGAEVRAVDGFLTLPDSDAPELVVCQELGGAWVAESEHERVVLADGATLEAAGATWVLRLPALTAPTVDVDQPNMANIEIRFAVSRDEEFVESRIVHRERVIELPARAFTYMLLTLARIRCRDREEGALPRSEQGWIHQEDLARMLAVDPSNVNVNISRARRQFASAGVTGAAALVERRFGTGQLRLGTDRVEIGQL